MIAGVQSILSALDRPAWLWSVDGTLLAANASLCDLVGTKNLPIGQRWPADGSNSDIMAEALRDPDTAVQTVLNLTGSGMAQDAASMAGLRSCKIRAVVEKGQTVAILGLVALDPVSRINPVAFSDARKNFDTAMETAGVVLWTLDPSSGAMDVSSNFWQFHGLPATFEPSLETIAALLHPDDQEVTLARLSAFLERGAGSYEVEQRMRGSDGDWMWLRVRAAWREVAPGVPPLICGSAIDIDVQKQQELALKSALDETKANRDALERARNEARDLTQMFRFSVSNGAIGPFSFCPETSEAWMMDETFGMLGYAPGAFHPDFAARLDMLHPDDVARKKRGTAALLAGEIEVYDHETRVRHANGTYHWYRTISRLVDRSDQGLPPMVAGVMMQIDDQKEHEARLAHALAEAEKTRDLLDRLANNVPTALYEVRSNDAGHFEMPFFSRMMPDMFAATAEELRADPSVRLRHMVPEDAQLFQDSIAEAKRTLNPLDVRVRIEHPAKGLRWLQINAVSERLPNGMLATYACVSDITAQVETETRMAQTAAAVLAADERLRLITERAPSGLYDFRLKPDGSMVLPYVNAKMVDLFGMDPEAETYDSSDAFRHIHPEDAPKVLEETLRSAADLSTFELKFRVQHPERGLLWVQAQSDPYREKDGTTIWYGAVFDLTAQREMERRSTAAAAELKAAHARLGNIADAAPVGIFETKRDPDGTIGLEYTSARFDEMVGIGPGTPVEKMNALHRNVHPEDVAGLMKAREAACWQDGVYTHRFRVMLPEHGTRWLSTSMMPTRYPDGTVILNGAYVDVTKDVEREEELRKAHALAEAMRGENEHQALHDVLTGLPNRRYFDMVMADCFETARQFPGQRRVTLIRIDGDRFKYINDTFGHEAGDSVLIRIADVFRETMRTGDFAARIGGDEFSILLQNGQTEEEAQHLVHRIQTGLQEPLYFEGRRCLIQASFGVATVDGMEESAGDLLAFADAALYQAKAEGRNRLALFSPDLRAEISSTRRLASELQDAITRDEFEPYFQVQIDVRRNELAGVEALLRWHHPEQGVLTPPAFLHVAEQLRIVPDLDKLVMEKSRAALQRLRADGLEVPKISFNVSSGRMLDPDVVASAQGLLDDGVKVTFELLESVLVEEASDIFKFHLDQLRDLGIEIEIDDFGSGHASIIALMAVAPSALKIDRRIVSPVADDVRAGKMVRAIVEIAETLEIDTIAEGVETAEQARLIRDLGCDVVQGYYFSRPISETDFAGLLREAPWTRDSGLRLPRTA